MSKERVCMFYVGCLLLLPSASELMMMMSVDIPFFFFFLFSPALQLPADGKTYESLRESRHFIIERVTGTKEGKPGRRRRRQRRRGIRTSWLCRSAARTDGFDMTFDPFVLLHYSFSFFFLFFYRWGASNRGVTNWDSNRPLSLPRCESDCIQSCVCAGRTDGPSKPKRGRISNFKQRQTTKTWCVCVCVQRTKSQRCIIHARSFSDRFPRDLCRGWIGRECVRLLYYEEEISAGWTDADAGINKANKPQIAKTFRPDVKRNKRHNKIAKAEIGKQLNRPWQCVVIESIILLLLWQQHGRWAKETD